MRIQKLVYDGSEISQIYCSISEENMENEISDLKANSKNLSLFISGKNNTLNIIKEMIDYEKSLEDI